MFAAGDNGSSSSSASPSGVVGQSSSSSGIGQIFYPNLLPDRCTRFEITVTDPERKGEGMQQYICYKVNSLLEYATGPAKQSCVIRRFSDFVWLHKSLEEDLKGQLIPALPDKGLMGRFSPEFVEERRRALQLFLNRVMEHEIIRSHSNVRLFLTGTDTALETHRKKTELGVKKAATKSIMSFFTSSVQFVTSTIVPGKDHPKSEDDIACEKIEEYAVVLQQELSMLESQVEQWLGKEKVLGKAWFDLGLSVSMVAQTEGAGRAVAEGDRPAMGSPGVHGASHTDYIAPPVISASSSAAYTSFTDSSLGLGGDAELSRLLSLLGSSSDQLSMLYQKKESEENLEFREPLKDAQRTAAAVENMLKARAACLTEYHHALDAVDSARTKLATAQGTPGKEGKIAGYEAAAVSAEQIADNKKLELAQMSAAVRSEFDRSQREKNAALSQIVRTFIQLQVEHSNKVTGVWNNVLNQVNNL